MIRASRCLERAGAWSEPCKRRVPKKLERAANEELAVQRLREEKQERLDEAARAELDEP